MLDAQSHQPIGSVFVLKRSEAVPSFAAVEAWIEQDVYHENKSERGTHAAAAAAALTV